MTAGEVGYFLLVIFLTIISFLATIAVLYLLGRVLVVAPPTPLERLYALLRAAGRPRVVRVARHTPEARRLALTTGGATP